MNSEFDMKAHEELLTLAIDSLAVLDEAGTLQYVSPMTEQMLGYEPDEVVGDSLLQYLHPDDQDAAQEAFSQLKTAESEGIIEGLEIRVIDGDGSWVWTESRIANPDATDIDGYLLISRDISSRKKAEHDLYQTRDLLEQTERIADVGGWEIDTETEEVFWTDHLFDLLGVEFDEEPPLDEALDLYHEEDRPRVANAIDEALASGEPFDVEARFWRGDGELRWFHIQGIPTVTDGAVEAFRGAVQDITEKKERERELQELTTRLELALRGTNTGVWEWDLDTNEVVWDEQMEQLFGYDVGGFEGTYEAFRGRVHPDDIDDVEAAHERGMESGYYDAEFRVVVDGTTERWVWARANVLYDDGEPSKMVGVVTDISEQKRRREELQVQKERLEEFTSVVSHDLRSPLTVAQGYLTLAAEEYDSDHLDGVERALGRMGELIDDLLSLAREGDDVHEFNQVELTGLAKEAWSHVETAEATLVTNTDRCIMADRGRTQQLLENLFRNAVEHAGHDVEVTVGTLDDGFYIEDDGPGIPPEDREVIFDSGYSTTEDGTGFGLSIVEQIVTAHGWDVRIADGSSGGARFEVTGVAFADS